MLKHGGSSTSYIRKWNSHFKCTPTKCDPRENLHKLIFCSHKICSTWSSGFPNTRFSPSLYIYAHDIYYMYLNMHLYVHVGVCTYLKCIVNSQLFSVMERKGEQWKMMHKSTYTFYFNFGKKACMCTGLPRVAHTHVLSHSLSIHSLPISLPSLSS